jgi:outer membrane protein assembly factor BamB
MRPLVRIIGFAFVVCMLGACASSARSGAPSSSTTTSNATSEVPPAGTGPAGTTPPNVAGADWPTYDGDIARTGLSRNGPAAAGDVHKLWASPTLDGDVYAQPLAVGGRILVATENDSVYALNATTGAVVWKRHLGRPVPASSLPCGNVDPVGITGTPVADAHSKRVFVVGMVEPGRHELFVLDSTTGRVVSSIAADARGADPAVQNQRGALSLSNGTVFVPYGGRYGDCGDYHGRLVTVAVSAAGLGRSASYTLPTQREGGFWAPPGPVIANDGSVLLASGNSSSSGTYDYGNSVVRISASLRLVDSWAPTDWASLNSTDTDVGSTSPVLLPGGRVFQIGKQGTGYLLDAAHLGGIGGELHSGDVCNGGSVFGGIAHDGDVMYVPCSDGVVQVTVDGSSFKTGWTASMSTPGPTVVAAGTVWVVATDRGDLIAIDQASGHELVTLRLGHVPSRFTSPAIGYRRVVVGAGRVVFAFGH